MLLVCDFRDFPLCGIQLFIAVTNNAATVDIITFLIP